MDTQAMTEEAYMMDGWFRNMVKCAQNASDAEWDRHASHPGVVHNAIACVIAYMGCSRPNLVAEMHRRILRLLPADVLAQWRRYLKSLLNEQGPSSVCCPLP
ncbi:hypothetical protein CALVIDRAFT_369780 [Calocera viscosa TUFC12733]|uniref:Uncharacterized protein n=1 Tax=Calocera viscosa (strain TUFC12733) TaxID=1330018 RepID=A0A167GXD4_CALVF|nr:hypothetical protein CALVIDRAFT_369780 [Calocera viscosa TUFC12733]